MKKILYAIGFFLAMSCTDFVDPAIPYSGFDTAIYLRTISVNANYNFFDLANEEFNLVVEAVDESNGNSVEQVEIFVNRRRGAALTTPVLLTTIPKSEFTSNTESKYLRASIEITLSAAVTAMGLTIGDIAQGDFIEYRLSLLDSKGRVFTNTNLSPDISGGAFYRSPFFYRIPIVCPSDLAGTFNFSSTAMSSAFGSCPGTITGQVTLTAVTGTTSYIVSDATFGFWDCYGDVFTGTGVQLNDVCGSLSFSGTDKYGDSYTFNFISNDGTSLVFRWVNASNEEGTVTLTANAGKPWPLSLN